MIDLSGVNHFPALEDIVDVLCNRTQNTERGFFRVEAAYFLAKMASSMRATIMTKDRGEIPVNLYVLALATSGYGKGHSIHLIEDQFLKPFERRFRDDAFPVIADKTLWENAKKRAIRYATDEQEEYEKLSKEWQSAGAFPFTFDSGTPPAVKQLRHKLLLSGIGSINLQIDEIGSNLIANTDVLTLFLELFDQGIVKQKLVKNTADNQRGEEVDGKTPTNMLLFGTPAKLLDGGQTEDQFFSFLDTGYARRCLFGMGQAQKRVDDTRSPAEIYAKLTAPNNDQSLNSWATHFHKLADPANYGWRMKVDDPVGIKLLEYKMACERFADTLKEHEEIRKAEISHRYFKALKIAGAYAFVDQSNEITMEHLLSAILLVEESGESFKQILSREKSYVKLAKYIADIGDEVTHADLHEALPFYGRGTAARNELMGLAQAWGYKRHIIIKKSFVDGIEFFKGEKLQETNLDEMILSYSTDWAYNYLGEKVKFGELGKLFQAQGYHWVNHFLDKGHRSEPTVIPGFNMVVIDVDGGINIETVHDLMKPYKHITYTTKRHQKIDERGHPLGDRFRLILPINYVLNMDTDEYKEFMNNIMKWLPFAADESANQRAKKWESYGGEGAKFHISTEGELLDVLDFIPKTRRNEDYQKSTQQLASLDNLERWFAQRIAMGNRNNNMIKYALALVDSGMDVIQVNRQVHAFNKKLNNPLDENEIDNTVLVTVAKRITQQN